MKVETFVYIITFALTYNDYVCLVQSAQFKRLEHSFQRQLQLQRNSKQSRLEKSAIHSKYISSNSLRGGSSEPPGSTFWQRRPAKPTGNNPLFGQSSGVPQPTFRQPKRQTEDDEYQAEQMATKDTINEFLAREDRTSFIARVYGILTGQLLVTSLSILAFSKNPAIAMWMLNKGRFVPMMSLMMSTVAFSFMSISEEARQSSPRKWQLLTLFTIGEAIAVGFIASLYSSKNVISAMLATALGTVSVTLYTLMNKNPKRDLSQWGAGLSSVATIFLVYSLIHILSLVGILPANFMPYNESIFCVLGASLFSLYLAYHTRLIVSGKYTKYQLNRKDYVFGAMLLYNDIINIFLYILRLLGDRDD